MMLRVRLGKLGERHYEALLRGDSWLPLCILDVPQVISADKGSELLRVRTRVWR